ncbi:MAG: hypothetical protein EOP53_26480, partial [Sphingobacteriales bacterium]
EQKKDTTVNGLFEKAGDYLETRLDLVKLKTTRTTSDVVATFVSTGLVLIFLIFFLLFINVGLALVIGKALGETSYGFFIVGGFYALVGIIFHLLREKWVKDPISNIIIKKMTKL